MTSRASIPPSSIPDPLIAIARAVRARGGRALVVGGWVRDRLLGLESKDFDLEVYGLQLAALEETLSGFGEVIAVGRSFGVLRVKGIDGDISIPRRDSKAGRGHRGFIAELDPTLGYAEAARRRDLTINAIAFDPLTGEVIDPLGGQEDLARRVLRAACPERFAEDPLRALRVAQFRARLEMEPDAELRELCSRIDLYDLPGERIQEELKKLLLRARRPSLGLEFLRETGLLRFFPELHAMVGVPQEGEWHPEGTVWEHTLLAVDEAAASKTGRDEEDLLVLLAALCHDAGKPETTEVAGGRVRSIGHEEAGARIARSFLLRLRFPLEVVVKVCALVRYHMVPLNLYAGQSSDKAFRRLGRKLAKVGISPRLVYAVARADHLGRKTPDALARTFPVGDAFIRRFETLESAEGRPKDAVQGRHLVERGYEPSPWFGEVLEACREVQDETGWNDPKRILDEALRRVPPPDEPRP
ncbi:MAG: CCA tRNA nucleotidyltransferase [Planctomycetota bacterium]